MVSCEALKALPVAYQKDGKASPAGAGWEDAAQYLGDLIKFTCFGIPIQLWFSVSDSTSVCCFCLLVFGGTQYKVPPQLHAQGARSLAPEAHANGEFVDALQQCFCEAAGFVASKIRCPAIEYSAGGSDCGESQVMLDQLEDDERSVGPRLGIAGFPENQLRPHCCWWTCRQAWWDDNLALGRFGVSHELSIALLKQEPCWYPCNRPKRQRLLTIACKKTSGCDWVLYVKPLTKALLCYSHLPLVDGRNQPPIQALMFDKPL
jgi:hypothetical protein